MRLTRRVTLGGKHLDELHESIVIRSIDTGMPEESVTAVSRMGGAGQRLTGAHYNVLTVTVKFAIDIPKTKLAERRAVLDAVNAWAIGGGWLVTNEMPDRRMWAERVSLSSAGDLFDWTSDYTLTFKSFGVPFWRDKAPYTKEKQLTNGGMIVDVGGNVQTVLDATFENKSGKTINKFKISVGDSYFSFTDLGLGGTDTLQIAHTVTGLLRIRINKVNGTSTSVIAKRTGSDDLYIEPGRQTIAIESQRAGLLTASVTGRWL